MQASSPKCLGGKAAASLTSLQSIVSMGSIKQLIGQCQCRSLLIKSRAEPANLVELACLGPDFPDGVDHLVCIMETLRHHNIRIDRMADFAPRLIRRQRVELSGMLLHSTPPGPSQRLSRLCLFFCRWWRHWLAQVSQKFRVCGFSLGGRIFVGAL